VTPEINAMSTLLLAAVALGLCFAGIALKRQQRA
jgi:ABC-type spermidine/putrescine transport system permease subunit II